MSEGCGTCTLCCKIMKIDDLQKPAHKWCEHCDIGHGCRIYDTRPGNCRDWSCYWLQSQDRADPAERMAPELRPDRSHVIVDGLMDGKGLVLFVEPAYPHAYKRADVWRIVERTVQRGMRVVIATGSRRKLVEQTREIDL